MIVLAPLLPPSKSEAQQVLYWDRDPIVDGVQDGGNGSIWDAANRANWLPSPSSPSTQNTMWPGGASGFDTIAAFGNGGVLDSRDMRIVNVSGTVNAGGLLFRPIALGPAEGAPPSATLYTSYGLVGGVISLAENANIEIGENTSSMSLSQRVTLVSQIAGHNINITRTAGATDWGFLEVRGPNTWTGTLNVGPQVFLELRAVAASNTLTSVNIADSTTLSLFYTAGGDSNYTNAISLTGEGFGGRGALRFDETLTQSGNITLTGDASIGTGASNFTGTIAGSIGQSGGSRVLKINGNGIGGKIILQGNNTFTGGVEILAGTLRITGDSSLGAVPASADANNITMNGGILQLAGSFNIHANRGILLQTRGGTIDTEAQNTTYAGIISGNGPLSKAGTGTLTLSGANTYSGETRVLGVLVVANDQALGDSSQGTIVSGSIGRLELTGGVTVTGESLITPTLSNRSGNNTWDGSVRAAVGIVMVLESKEGSLLISGNVSAQSTDGIDHSLTLQGDGDAEISGSLTRAINLSKSGTGT
ncbi:MAG: autotransporter-associated beta strand repeat-containing protein, partial [Verrucomicrobium sp.]